MAGPIIYLDHSKVREGGLAELREALDELAAFVQANEPHLLAYNVYFSEDGASVSILHVHHDSASLEYHMKVAGPLFPRFARLVELQTIDIYGSPSITVLERLREKARLLGRGTVRVHTHHRGFSRFAVPSAV